MTSTRLRVASKISGVALWLLVATPAFAQDAVFLIRHAEKVDNSSDAGLSDAGRARARLLARLLKDAGIDAVYSTDFKRTRDTAAPLASTLGLRVTIVAHEPAAVVAHLHALGANDVALVVAHSDTLPDILRRLGYPAAISIADQEYDNLFILVARKDEPPAFLRLRY